MSEHTPGPWHVRKCDGLYRPFDTDDFAVVSEGLITPALVWGGTAFEEGKSNARLIAAAPDLLAALKGARAQLLRMSHRADVSGIDAAIAKAEGEP